MDINRRHFMVGAALTAVQATRVMGANDRIRVTVVGCGNRGLLKEVLQLSAAGNATYGGSSAKLAPPPS
jgi:hypothetical protein